MAILCSQPLQPLRKSPEPIVHLRNGECCFLGWRGSAWGTASTLELAKSLLLQPWLRSASSNAERAGRNM